MEIMGLSPVGFGMVFIYLIRQDQGPLGPPGDRVHLQSQVGPGANFVSLGH